MQRTDNTRLPGNDELSRILEQEAYRPLPSGKEDIHYPNFESIVELLRHLGLSDTLFTGEVATIHEAVARGDALLDDIVSD